MGSVGGEGVRSPQTGTLGNLRTFYRSCENVGDEVAFVQPLLCCFHFASLNGGTGNSNPVRSTPKERIADIATGTGWTSRAVAQFGVEVVGIDIAEGMLAAAREIASRDVDGFATRYTSATGDQLEAWKDDLLAIADDSHLEPNDRRIRIDTRKWLMSKLHPQKYGDKVTVAGDPDAPLQHVVSRLDVAKLSGPELDALERFTDARLAAKDVEDQGQPE